MTRIVDRRAEDENEILIVCDFSPPRGGRGEFMAPAARLGADFISMAYNPGRSVRVSSVLGALWVKQETQADAVFTLATRDMNKVALQSLLLGAALHGLDNVVVVKGDSFTERETGATKPVDDFTPTGLIASIAQLNAGVDFRGRSLRAPTDICVGAAIDLGHDPDRELRLTRRKVEAGAQFFLLQPLFDPVRVLDLKERYERAYAEELSQPLFCGVQVMAAGGVTFGAVPEWVRRDLEGGRSGADIAVEVLQGFVESGLRSIYLVPPILRGGRRDYDAAQRVIETAKG